MGAATFFLDDFARRQWAPDHAGTRLTVDQDAFVAEIERLHASGAAPLKEGYAPFCKHVFVPNFTPAEAGAVAITDANRDCLVSGYVARRPEELPVLARWFPRDRIDPGPAKYLDVILYSREQILEEYEALPPAEGGKGPDAIPDAPWGIISIKAQNEDHETPMQVRRKARAAEGKRRTTRSNRERTEQNDAVDAAPSIPAPPRFSPSSLCLLIHLPGRVPPAANHRVPPPVSASPPVLTRLPCSNCRSRSPCCATVSARIKAAVACL